MKDYDYTDNKPCKNFVKALSKMCEKLSLLQYQKELISQETGELKLYEYKKYPNTYEIINSLEVLESKPLDIDIQISNIKRQLKYEKNPLAIKNLNRKMNKLIKEKKNV